MFCPPGLIFDATEGVGFRLQVLRFRTRVEQYRGRWIPFSSFALSDSFWTVPMASSPVFIFCAPGLVFDGKEGIRSRFLVLHSRTRFGRKRGHWVLCSCIALPYSFWAVPMAPCPVFIFCASGLVFDCTEGVGSRFHVWRSRTHFGLYRWRRALFSCFALPDSFSTLPRVLGSLFMFGSRRLILDGIEGVGSHFHVLISELIWGGTEGVKSYFHD
jgi:hypothetical protein